METKRGQRIVVLVAAVVGAAIVVGYMQYREARGLKGALLGSLVALVVTGIIFILAYRRAQQRQSALAGIASTLGFSFRSFDAEWTKPLGEFPIFKRKGSPQVKNLMRGVKEGKEVLLFEYTFSEGDAVRNQTAVCWRLRADSFPRFELGPEGFFQSIFEGGDIDFASHPEFSNRYLLKGPDEQAIRGLFQPRVLDAFTSRREFWVAQGDGEWLVVYRPRITVRPTADEVRKLLDEAFSLFAAFGKS